MNKLILSPKSQGSPTTKSKSDLTFQKQQLTESKILRKKAEEDAQLLANRIALLQLEEQKAMKKVEETKKKADEIMKQKNRNLEAQKQKTELQKEREAEERRLFYQNKVAKEKIKVNQEQRKEELVTQLTKEVTELKKAKHQHLTQIVTNRDLELAKNSQLVAQIKQAERDLQRKKIESIESVKEKAKQEYASKVEQEMTMKGSTDQFISELEKKEMELIQKLQNTQNLQKKAYDDLEKAMAVSLE